MMACLQRFAALALLAGVVLGSFPPGTLRGQEPLRPAVGNPASIITLQTDTNPEARRNAAEALAASPSPANVEVLRQVLLGDPDPSVCSAAATSLGKMGITSLPAIGALAQAGRRGCGSASTAPITSLGSIATALRDGAGLLTTDELQVAVGLFQEAETTLGAPFPGAVLESLEAVEAVVRVRRMGWIATTLALTMSLVQNLLSAAGSAVGVVAAVFLMGLLILLLRNAKKVLAFLGVRPGTDRAGQWEWEDVELWLRRPGALISRTEASPLRMVALLRKVGRDQGIELSYKSGELEERWDAFSQTAAGGRIPGFAAARWVDATLNEAREGNGTPPPGSLVEVILGEIHAKYVVGPDAPPRDLVEKTLQALAWETMKEGSFTGWVPNDGLNSTYRDPGLEVVLEYAEKKMGVVKRDVDRGRTRLVMDEELTARMGSLHLLRQQGAGPAEILAQMGTMYAAARGKDRRQAAVFLRRVASALLDAAASMDGDSPELGIAEEALLALADPQKGSGDSPTTVRVNRLLARLRVETHPAVRERIITAIGELGHEAKPALPALMASVENDPPGVALAALDAFGKMGPVAAPAAPLLLEALERGRPSLQAAAIRSLGRIGPAGEEGAETLLAWTSQGGVPHELQVRAAEALGGMPGHASTSIPNLAELLRSPVATEVRAAAALSLARLDPGRRDVEEVLRWAQRTTDPTLAGMVEIALLIRAQRAGDRRRRKTPVAVSDWLLPMGVTGSVVTILQLGAVVGSDVLNPRSVLPALFLAPVIAFMAGMVYAWVTRRIPLHPALGAGVMGWAGVSGGLLAGYLVSSAMTPFTLVMGGGLALASGAFGASLVQSALADF